MDVDWGRLAIARTLLRRAPTRGRGIRCRKRPRPAVRQRGASGSGIATACARLGVGRIGMVRDRTLGREREGAARVPQDAVNSLRPVSVNVSRADLRPIQPHRGLKKKTTNAAAEDEGGG